MPDEQEIRYNAWGQEVAPEQRDRFWAKPADRRKTDRGEGSNALEGGDEMVGWKPPNEGEE